MNKAERKQFYKSKAWQVTRQLVLERDGCECQHCKANGELSIKQNNVDKHKTLDIHHIQSLEEHPELGFDTDNLLTLCVKCHNKEEGRFQGFKRKKNKWANDEYW